MTAEVSDGRQYCRAYSGQLLAYQERREGCAVGSQISYSGAIAVFLRHFI